MSLHDIAQSILPGDRPISDYGNHHPILADWITRIDRNPPLVEVTEVFNTGKINVVVA